METSVDGNIIVRLKLKTRIKRKFVHMYIREEHINVRYLRQNFFLKDGLLWKSYTSTDNGSMTKVSNDKNH